MIKLDYFVEVSRAKEATRLHELARLAEVDSDLTRHEQAEVASAVARRFGHLNHQANPNPKPRWGA